MVQLFHILCFIWFGTSTFVWPEPNKRENVIWKCNFSFLQSFLNYSRSSRCKMCSNFPGIKLEPALQREEDKIEHLSSCANVVLTTAKQVISRRRKNENVCGMSKNENCTCKACKSIVFHCQICKFVTFLLPWSSRLRKLPNESCRSLTIL